MTGWRIGYTAGPLPLIKAMAKIQGQSTSNPTHISQFAALAGITGPQQRVAEMRKAFDERRQAMVRLLRAIPGVKCNEHKGAFYAFPDVSVYVGKKTPQGTVIADDVQVRLAHRGWQGRGRAGLRLRRPRLRPPRLRMLDAGHRDRHRSAELTRRIPLHRISLVISYPPMAGLTWLLQANLRDRRFFDELVHALDVLGETWTAVTLAPFRPELPEVPASIEAGQIVCYGPSFVPRVVGSRWKPGIFFDRDRFRWSAMQAHWQELMFATDGRLMELGQVLEELDGSQPAFVRPDADDKMFDGAVYDASTLREVTKTRDPYALVIRANPRTIDAEWRCFVVDGEVIGGSEYRRAGQPSLHAGVPPRVVDLAEHAAARWMPARVACIDVASSGDSFGIVEANCFNASRFYAADTVHVIERVAAHCRSLA